MCVCTCGLVKIKILCYYLDSTYAKFLMLKFNFIKFT